jgi:pyruvate,orthophosphate dikinase
MFYGKHAEEPLFLLRKMIASSTEAERRAALDELFVHVKADIKGTMEAMDGFPVTIRTLDPPLHEFIPLQKEGRDKIAKSLKISAEEFNRRAELLHETNPMMGHRGVRLGITFPEITEMQVRAIFEATAELIKAKKKPLPEIMIPVTCVDNELKHQYEIIAKVYQEVLSKFKMKEIPHMVGTMIEIPRACLTADKIAQQTQFFSFGTNDLTQMSFGFSRDDIGGFLPDYLEKKILPIDPFQSIDIDGVGQLMDIAVQKGRSTRKDLKIGICGEHGGEPASVEFCHKLGFSYVSCSPFRVPIARLAAAQAVIKEGKAAKAEPKKAAKPAAKKAKATAKKEPAIGKGRLISKIVKAVTKKEKAAPKKAEKATPKKAVKATPKKAEKVTPKKAVKATPKKAVKATPKKAVKAAPKKAVKAVAKKATKPATKTAKAKK